MIDIARELQVAINTGKVVIGFNRTVKAILYGSAKLVLVATNAPAHVKSDLEYYAKLGNVPIVTYPGSSWELGSAARKPFKISALAIIDPGQSEILKLAEYAGH